MPPELDIHHLYVERPRTCKLSCRRWIQCAGFSCYAINKINPLATKLCMNAQYTVYPVDWTLKSGVVPRWPKSHVQRRSRRANSHPKPVWHDQNAPYLKNHTQSSCRWLVHTLTSWQQCEDVWSLIYRLGEMCCVMHRQQCGDFWLLRYTRGLI